MSDSESTPSPDPPQPPPSSRVDVDQTVASSRPPIPTPFGHEGLHPMELGKLLEGQRLEHFELIEFIGGGGMGAVFRGIDTVLGRTVAVKVLATDQPGDDETRRRFRNEAQSAARLNHENIARVYYVGEQRGVHFIVFEYIDGTNLRDVVTQRGPLPLAEVVSYTLQIAEALAHASQRDVVHRDIKPSNVLITADGHAKLVDMGLARLHKVEHSQQDLTASGMTLGTFDYISPEQARDPRSADVRSDLYSLGCTVFFMLTGRPPFPDGTVLQKLLQHQGDSAPDIHPLRPDLPEGIAQISAKLLAKSPASRYQDPDELIANLLLFAEQVGLPATPPGGAVLIASPPHDPLFVTAHLPWLVPLTLLLVTVAMLHWLWSVQGDPALALPASLSRLPGESPAAPAGPAPAGPSPAGPAAGPGERRTSPSVPSDAAVQPAEVDRPWEDDARDSREPPGHTLPNDVPKSERTVDRADQPAAAGDVGRRMAASAGPDHGELAEDRPAENADRNSPDQNSADRNADPNRAERIGTAADAGRSGGNIDVDSAAEHVAPGGVAAQGPVGPPTTTDPSPVPLAPLPKRTNVVHPAAADWGDGYYATLSDAVEDARSGDVIELRFNGRQETSRLMLADRRLTLRSGDGYRPHVVFRPRSDEVDPALHPRTMITLSGGELTILNVDISLELPRSVHSENWALIETRGAGSVHFIGCWLTVRNANADGTAYHEGLAVFDIQAPPGLDVQMQTDDQAPVEPPVTIRLENCVVRGEATLMRNTRVQSVDFLWKNGLLVTSERLLELESSQSSLARHSTVEIELQHVTAVMRRGLLRATQWEDMPHGIPVDIKCSNSILMADRDAALVMHQGVDGAGEPDDLLTWQGDRNFYEGFHVFWSLRDSFGEEIDSLEFAAWQDNWREGDENLAQSGAVRFRQIPDPVRPPHQHVIADYALEQDASNPPVAAASDGTDAGFLADLIPAETARAESKLPWPPEPPDDHPAKSAAPR